MFLLLGITNKETTFRLVCTVSAFDLQILTQISGKLILSCFVIQKQVKDEGVYNHHDKWRFIEQTRPITLKITTKITSDVKVRWNSFSFHLPSTLYAVINTHVKPVKCIREQLSRILITNHNNFEKKDDRVQW